MLTLVALTSNTTSVTFMNNSQTFQGSLWCQPSSSMTFVKNGVTVEGPISIGSSTLRSITQSSSRCR